MFNFATKHPFVKYQILPPQQVRLILKLLRKNLLLLILLPSVGAFYGFYKAYRIPNVYRAQSQFLYKGQQEESVFGGRSPYARYAMGLNDAENQKRIIKSYDLIGDVVDRLNFEVSYYLVGRIRKTVQYPNPGLFRVVVDTINPSMVGVPYQLRFTNANVELMHVNRSGDEVVEQFPFEKQILAEGIHFQFDLRGGYSMEDMRNHVSTYEFVVNSRERLVQTFRSKLAVSMPERSSVITASLSDQSAERAIDFLDTLAMVYAKFSTREKRNENKTSLEFIEEQIANVTSSINQSEFEVEGVKESNSIINLTVEQSRYNEKLLEYEDNLLELDIQGQRLDQLKEYLNEADEGNFMPPSVYIPEGDPFLSEKLKELYDVLKERESQLLNVTANNPLVQQNQALFTKVKTELINYIEKTKAALSKERTQIQSMISRYEGNLRSLPQSQREILNIERRIAVNEKLYNYLLEQRATKIIEAASINPEFEILDNARSYGVVGPDRNAMVKNYLLYGFGIVVVIGAIRFFFLDKVESLKELQDVVGKTVVGGVPKFKSIVPFEDPDYINTDQAFAFRKLRTSLQFMASNAGRGDRVLLVSSMYPSEGKTFVSSSLGYLHSLSGKKVVIVDFDLHKPNLHKQFGLDKNISGLSMILTGNATFEESYQEVTPNLHVVTSGPLPPNPSELVIREETINLVEQLKQEYDLVILDTPPVVPVTDAKVLMKLTDLNLIVLNNKHATRRNISTVEDIIEEVGERNTGIVFNAIRTPTLMALYGKYAYKYGYTYGYNYGYGYEYSYRYGRNKS